MKTINIGGRQVGEGEPCFIIAEAGVNHNGDINLAKRLIDVACQAGADAVKFQAFRAEEIVTPGAAKARYQRETGNETQFEMLQRLELGQADFRQLSAYAQQKGIVFLATPFDKDSVDLLADLGVPAYKVASGEITNLSLLRHIADRQKPVILSTGMSTIGEVEAAVALLREEGSGEIVLLHCVSAYPARAEDMNLRVMATLRRTFDLPVGLSDHTVGVSVPIAAVALGACVIEKHFTLDKKLPGPDHRASLEPDELKAMVKAIREVEKALGDGVRRLTGEEAENKQAVRRSLVARIDIPAGTVITRKMLAIKRPGTGLEPGVLDSVIGKKARKSMKSGEVLTVTSVG